MANIQQYLDDIANAEKGEDVRWSIHDGIEAINNEVIANTAASNDAVAEATAASTAAQQSAASSAESAEAANAANEQYNVFINMPINRNTFIKEQLIGSTLTDEIISDIVGGNFSEVTIGSRIGDWICVHINYANSFGNTNFAVFMLLENFGWLGYSNTPTTDKSKGYAGLKIFDKNASMYNTLISNLNSHNLTDHISTFPIGVATIVSTNGISITNYNSNFHIPSIRNVFGITGIGSRDVVGAPWSDQFALFKLGGFKFIRPNPVFLWGIENIDGTFNTNYSIKDLASGLIVPTTGNFDSNINGNFTPYVLISR